MTSDNPVADLIRQIPHTAVLIFGKRNISGADIVRLAHRQAAALRSRGITPGRTVGWLAFDEPEALTGRLAVHLLGATFLGLPPSAPAPIRRAATDLIGDGVLVTDPTELPGNDSGMPIEPTAVNAALPATLRLVSGSPRPVTTTYRELGERLRALCTGRPGERHAVLHPLGGLGGDLALATLVDGGTVLCLDAHDQPARLLAALERGGATRLSLPSALLDAISREPAAPLTDLSALRQVIHTGPIRAAATTDLFGPLLLPLPDDELPADEEPEPTPQVLREALAEAQAQVDGVTTEQVASFDARSTRTALVSMVWALQRRDVLTDPSRTWSAAEILAGAGVAAHHHGLVRHWLDLLAGHQVLARDGDRYHGHPPVPDAEFTDRWERLARAWTGLGSPAFVDYLRRNAEALPELLTGARQATLLLFPEGRTDTAEAIYRDTATARYLNAAVAALVAAVAERHPGDRPLRVLEVGAGTGATTERVLDALAGRAVDYLFTDVSRFFLPTARSRFGGYGGMRFGVFDVDAAPGAQGHPAGSYDVLIAAGVLNNARDTAATVASLAGLLRPGGWLLVTEPVREHYEMLISQAFMMSPAEGARADAGATFLSRDRWLEVFAAAGLERVLTAPAEDHPIAGLGQRLFVLRA